MTEKTFGDLVDPRGSSTSWRRRTSRRWWPSCRATRPRTSRARCSACQGGLVQLYQGWTPVAELSKDARWTPAELAGRMGELFGDRADRPTRRPVAPSAVPPGIGGTVRRRRPDGDVLRQRHAVRRATRCAAGPACWSATAASSGSGPHARAPREARAAEVDRPQGGRSRPGSSTATSTCASTARPDFVAEAQVTEAYAAIKCVANAARHLAAGVTTVRDLGRAGPSRPTSARAIADGRVPGPRVVASRPGAHDHGRPRVELVRAPGGRAGRRPPRRARADPRGARSIKIVATGGVLTPGDHVRLHGVHGGGGGRRRRRGAHMGRAHRRARHRRTGIERCVRAGIDSIEHGSQIDAATAKQMKERGTFHVPTSARSAGSSTTPRTSPPTRSRRAGSAGDRPGRVPPGGPAGVRLAVGTDAGTPYNPHGSAPNEIVRMVEWGLTPLKALQAATSYAAELLRVPDVGTVEAGRSPTSRCTRLSPSRTCRPASRRPWSCQVGQIWFCRLDGF